VLGPGGRSRAPISVCGGIQVHPICFSSFGTSLALPFQVFSRLFVRWQQTRIPSTPYHTVFFAAWCAGARQSRAAITHMFILIVRLDVFLSTAHLLNICPRVSVLHRRQIKARVCDQETIDASGGRRRRHCRGHGRHEKCIVNLIYLQDFYSLSYTICGDKIAGEATTVRAARQRSWGRR
jgi:hypothetical protein